MPIAISVPKLLNPGLPLELLRVDKQIHEEAAEAFYGGNRFIFIVGLTARVRRMLRPQTHMCGDQYCRIHYKCYPQAYDGSRFTYDDNLFDLPYPYLKLIKRCDNHVQMSAIPDRKEP